MISVLICDDSPLACKMLARSLPAELAHKVELVENGQEALTHARDGHIDLLLLDLNMPTMNGYEVLQTLRDEDIPIMTIVVSGDVQAQARERVKALGALDFLAKPLNISALHNVLQKYGLLESQTRTQHEATATLVKTTNKLENETVLQEVFNIAMGRAGAALSTLLNSFIELPVPKVKTLCLHDLVPSLSLRTAPTWSAVSQGFAGSQVRGEAVVLLDDTSVPLLNSLFPTTTASNDTAVDLLFDIASILTGASLEGLSEQLDLDFGYASPVLLGRHASITELLNCTSDSTVLLVELNYHLFAGNVECTVLFLITESSLPPLYERLELLQ